MVKVVAKLQNGHPTFNDGNPYNGYINPYYWVDDHPLLCCVSLCFKIVERHLPELWGFWNLLDFSTTDFTDWGLKLSNMWSIHVYAFSTMTLWSLLLHKWLSYACVPPKPNQHRQDYWPNPISFHASALAKPHTSIQRCMDYRSIRKIPSRFLPSIFLEDSTNPDPQVPCPRQ